MKDMINFGNKNHALKAVALFLLSFVFSCGQSMGDRIDIDELKVFYLEPFEKNEAVKFAKYWRDNGFLGDEPQFIQLSISENNIVQIKLIEKEKYHNQYLSIKEQALLSDLERLLEKDVFNKSVVITITDNTFAEIERE